ncbi:hypothetical protein QBC46DRAFT_401892 [Diplogelasinospora grovesii]|uniref:Uncharacterized protein n=1 Tax=Diplogelasinospora grovesii TaxID=303347 RepID=A0AAN6MU50_9PEZI|nr:hypothetical protein QBC46DRAFT_401892 [Diplogelasinospora grovesii]
MTRHVSQCCRALQRKLTTSPGDGVWISEGLFLAAFERYCLASSRCQRRKASHVPGPLESRRRLGKRHIGDLNAIQCAASPPAWAFAVPMDLSQWQWQPPLSASALEQNRQQLRERLNSTASGWLASVAMPRWLEHWVPHAAEEQEQVQQVIDYTPPDAVVAAPRQPSFNDEVDAFCTRRVSKCSLQKHTPDLCRRLERHIFLGEITPEEVLPISEKIASVLDRRYKRGSGKGQGLYLSLYSAIINGIATSKVATPSLFGAPFWNTILERMSEMSVSNELGHLFKTVLNTIPAACLGDVREGLLSMLRSFFSSLRHTPEDWDAVEIPRRLEEVRVANRRLRRYYFETLYAFRWGDEPRWKRFLELARQESTIAQSAADKADAAMSPYLLDVRLVAKAIESLNPQDHGYVFEAANQFVLKGTRACAGRKARHGRRLNWLCVLAHLPQVNQDYFFETIASHYVKQRDIDPLTTREICSLMIYQWGSRGYLAFPDKAYDKFEQLMWGRPDSVALAALALAVFNKATYLERKGILHSLWKLVARLGRSDAMLESVKEYAQHHELPLGLLQSLAYTCYNHRAAIEFHKLYINQSQNTPSPEWDPAVFKHHAEAIVLDPSLPSDAIWRALDIDMYRLGSQRLWVQKKRHFGEFGATRATIVEKIAPLFAQAPHLRNRVALRHVSQCVRFLQEYYRYEGKGARLSPGVMKALYHAVSQDMKEGRPGRTSRLRWFLSIVDSEYGAENARACGLALERWREMLKRNLVQGKLGSAEGRQSTKKQLQEGQQEEEEQDEKLLAVAQ